MDYCLEELVCRQRVRVEQHSKLEKKSRAASLSLRHHVRSPHKLKKRSRPMEFQEGFVQFHVRAGSQADFASVSVKLRSS